jgi:hypothetical protein
MLEDVVDALDEKIAVPSKISRWQKALYENLIVRRVVDDNRDAISAWVQKKLLSN